MDKLKIAQVITRLDWGGSPDIVRIIFESMTSKHHVKLITGPSVYLTSKTKHFLEKFKDDIIIVPYLKRNINPLWDFLAWVNLYFIFKKEKFDIVHTHTAKAGILGRLAAFMAGTWKIIHMPHGHNFYGYFGSCRSKLIVVIEKIAARFTDKIVVLTELEKNDFLSFKIKDQKDIEVVPSGLELEDFCRVDEGEHGSKRKSLGLEPHDKVVGMISRLEPIKGPQYFIESAAEVIKTIGDVKFLVVGEGSLHSELEKQAETVGLKDKIKFLGWRDDTLEIMPILDILVQPSLNEAVGRVLLEAQALGVPVVATNVGGIPEVVQDGSTGVIVPSKDSKAIAKAICYLLENEEDRSIMSQKAKQWIKDRFSSQKMTEEIDRVYRELVENE